MLRALYSAAAGMQSQQMNLDVISNNLANANTTGYKMTTLQFQDLLYENSREAGSQQGGGNQLPSSLQIGQGSTRDGSFKTDSQGRIVTSDGYPVQGGFQPVPDGTTGITITANGSVTYTTSSGNSSSQVQLARFTNPGGLDAVGHNLYKQTEASGTPELGNPADSGFGELQQGSLELSNVSVVQEMVNLILAQRAYEVNSKAVQAADEMMQTSNNLQH